MSEPPTNMSEIIEMAWCDKSSFDDIHRLIPTAKKVDTFSAVLCLTAETLRVSPPLRLYPEALS